jgi:hypothetical protein
VINGGWHDAGDLSQSTQHTSGAIHAFFSLAEKFQDTDTGLSERLLEEAKWGLEWVLKTRFNACQIAFHSASIHLPDDGCFANLEAML